MPIWEPSTNWNYFANGEDWPTRFEDCNTDKQSPIDLGGFHHKESVARPISYFWEDLYLDNEYMANDPSQTVMFPWRPYDEYPKPYTRFFGPNTDIQQNINFLIQDMSFHAPSEHTISKEHSALELQFKHKAVKENQVGIFAVLFDPVLGSAEENIFIREFIAASEAKVNQEPDLPIDMGGFIERIDMK